MTLQKIKDELAELRTMLGNLVSGKSSSEQITSFDGRLKAVEASAGTLLAEKDKTIETRDATIKDLNTKLETAQGQVNAQGTQIKDLEGKVATALKKANEVIASQGLDPAALPAAEQTAGGMAVKTAWETYCALQASNPREAGAYYQANADKILASRK